jgi:hypothetical protein
MASFGDFTGLGKLRLTVTSGASSGATALVDTSGCKIGSGLNDDFVLIAYDLFESHAQVSGGSLPFMRARVSALGGSVRVGARDIDPGQFADVPLPAQIKAGGCEILIERPALTSRHMAFVGATLGLMLMGLIGYQVITATTPIATEFKPIAAANPETEMVSDALVREKLVSLGLDAQIRLNRAPDGSITLGGQFTTRTADAWREFLQWYDAQPNLPMLLNSVTRADGRDDLPKIGSVWAQEPPELVMEDGRVVRVGEQLDINWRFDGITEKGIEISRNGAKVLIEF